MQRMFARDGDSYVARNFPAADTPLGDGSIVWGRIEELGTPGYWASQAWLWEIENPEHFRLGRSLEEELLACLLGGYGMPAEVGLAAYERLRGFLLSSPDALADNDIVFEQLTEPLTIGARKVHYRFPKQKARHVSGTFRQLATVDRSAPDRALRDDLTRLPGVGLKTASWVVRNTRASDEVAILDIHILRTCRGLGIFPEELTIERAYARLEEKFLNFAQALEIKASFLDSVIWMIARQIDVSGSEAAMPYGVRSTKKTENQTSKQLNLHF